MDYNALKVADLKGILKERGIPSTGLSRKQQIVDTLVSHDAGGEDGDGAGEDVDTGDPEGVVNETAGEESNAAQAESEAVRDAPAAAQERDESKEADVEATESTAAPAEVTEESTTQPQTAPESLPTEPPVAVGSPHQPTVLESNQPVSKEPSALTTPRGTSPIGESTSSDRKRKRRSPTPPIDEETVNKKLKAADEDNAILPEVGSREDDITDTASTVAVVVQQASDAAHEKMDIDDVIAPVNDISEKSAPTELDGVADVPDQVQRSVHPPTRAIYIVNLVRPIQPGQLSDYLTELAVDPGDKLQHENLDNFHLGSIRTHAFAVFNSLAGATRVRNSLHGRVWPDEPARKALWVDFVPEEKVQEWIDRETEGTGRRDARRWEVVYDETDDGVVARHQEANAASGPNRRPSHVDTAGQGMGMPNAPLGPRSSRPSIPAIPPAQPKQSTPNPQSSASFVVLDERFPSTTTKPKLYYLPVSKDIADRRLDELARQTSREWGARGGELAGNGAVRRYTFEDQDRLVDGGPHYDDFSGPRGGGRGGRRGGGGGGFRGGRR